MVCFFAGRAKYIEGEPLGGLVTYARKLLEFFYQPGDGFSVIKHWGSKHISRKAKPSEVRSEFAFGRFVDFSPGLIDCGDDQILKHFDVAAFDGFRIDSNVDKLFRAVHRDVDDSAARSGLDANPLDFALHVFLHLFGLAHHLSQIHIAR
jgi:hypothetical protein